MNKCGVGLRKEVLGPDEEGYVIKKFKKRTDKKPGGVLKYLKERDKKPLPFEEQKNNLNIKMHYFGKYIPETALIDNGDGTYYIRQRYIKGKLLKDIDINHLSQETLSDLYELIEKYISYLKKEGKHPDTAGYQEDLMKIDNIRKRGIFSCLRLYKAFFASSNIIISDDGAVYMVDVCDVYEDDSIEGEKKLLDKIIFLIRDLIVNVIGNIGISRNKNTLRKLIKQNCKFELMKNLSTER